MAFQTNSKNLRWKGRMSGIAADSPNQGAGASIAQGAQILNTHSDNPMKSRFLLRIVAPSLAISILLLILGGFSGWYVHQQQKQASYLLGESVVRIRTAVEIVSACRETRFHLSQFSITGDPAFLEATQPILEGLSDQIQGAGERVISEEDKALLEQVQAGQRKLQSELHVLTEGPEADRRVRANEMAYGLITDAMVGPAERYFEASETGIDRVSRRSQAMAGRVSLGFLLLGVCGAVAGLLAGYAIARGVRHTLFQLHVPIRTATGKLEEVIGPIDVAEPRDLHDLDSLLDCLAERVSTVVDRLQESQLELLRAEQLAALGQMAAGLAHELRNPLTSIKILVQTAAEAGDGARLEGRDVSVLDEELTRLEGSIERFLDFARPPSLEKRQFDIRDVIQRTLELVSARVAQQQVCLKSSLPKGPVEILADREQIRQLLLNTVLNALDAVGHGGEIQLSLSLDDEKSDGHTGDGNGRWATLLVRDNGPGIPDELGDRVFEPFVSTKETGLGLGLAISRRIAEAHKGQILATNTNDGGAVLSIRLPLATFPANARPEE